MSTPIVAITMGDPAGIGPEITLRALLKRDHPRTYRPIVIGDLSRLELVRALLERQHRLEGPPVHLRPVSSIAEARFDPDQIEVIDLDNVPGDLSWGTVQAAAGAAAFAYVERATKLALANQVDAICTAPINKDAWRQAGTPYPGHTEALAALSGTTNYATMLMNGSLRVVHVTTHMSLEQAIRQTTTERILRTIELGSEWSRWAGLGRRIAVAGLNPHAGESGLLGSEEELQIAPAVQMARANGLNVTGPLSPDTVFARAAMGEFDLVVAQYHDQGHIPIKMLGLDTGVNVTIGLPIVRVSVDHGPAFDIAGKGKAREENLLEALDAAARLALVQKWQCACAAVGAHHQIPAERTVRS